MKEEKMSTVLYEIKTGEQKQNVLNLDLGENSEITVTTKTVSWKTAKDKDGKDVEPTTAEKLKVLQTLVSPAEKQVEALEKFFASESYRVSKEEALSKGNFLTQNLKSGIVNYLSAAYAQFSDLSAKEIFSRWLTGYKAKNKNAIEVLNRIKAAGETDLGF